MKTQTASALLELLDGRWREVIQHIPDPTSDRPFKRPAYGHPSEEKHRSLRAIAREHAEADNSDPFAGRRALHYMRQGYWLPSEVHEDARRSTQARRATGATFPTVSL